MLFDASKITYELLELFGKKVLYTLMRVDRATIPNGFYAYDLRDSCNGVPCSVEHRVICNHFGTIITKEPIEFDTNEPIEFDGRLDGSDCYKEIGSEDFNFLCEDVTLDEYMKDGD